MAATTVPALADDQAAPEKKTPVIKLVPKRKLGKTGVEVSMLNQGTSSKLDLRHLNIMHDEGIRYIDTASTYGGGESERTIAEWFQKTGYRKEYFLVTKDKPKAPEQWVDMLDRRLEALQTDYIDLYFIHNLGREAYGGEASADWIQDKAWTTAAEKIRNSGKARFLGFSTHCKLIGLRAKLLNTAAAGGWVDAIMVATNLTAMRENKEFNQALDNCHDAGVGLISMKECKDVAQVKKVFPRFKEKGLSKFTAVLTAMWTDERFSSISSAMDNINKLRENAAAARNFQPLTSDELVSVDMMLRGLDRMYCAACDGSCQRAAGTRADLNTIARYVSYVEECGQLKEARLLFAALPLEARNWRGADLQSASRACKCRMDFARIMKKAERYFA